MIGMMSLALKFCDDVRREEAHDHLAEALHLTLDGVGRALAELAVDAVARANARPSPSASTTAKALLNSSQKIERRPMLRSLARLPSDVIDETIATRISGATVASSTLM